jgi:hypothetical protein
MTNKFDRIHPNTNKKYIIRNCPNYFKTLSGNYYCDLNAGGCQDYTDCVLKQIVELCRKTVKIFSAESGTQPYAGGRCTEAEGILQLLDIQEVE